MRTATQNEVIVDALNSLIQTNHDSENGYRTAASGVDEESDLASIFHRYAQHHARFAAELEQEVRTYGGEPETGGTFGGSLASGWMNIKSAITGGDEDAILNECIRAEESAQENYQDALQEDLPDYLKEMLRQQHDQIQESIQHLRALKQSYER